MSGWIKLHRTLQKWGWKTSPYFTAVFIDLLLEANHEERQYLGVKIEKGSLTTSIRAISKRTGVSEMRVRGILERLKLTGEITTKPSLKFTMISITKWDEYQLRNTDINKPVTHKQHTVNERLTTNKNVIIKEGKKDLLPEALVIDYYNKANDRRIKQVDSNYKEIRARLKEGFTIDEMRLVIDHAAKNWTHDPFWGRLNRISTIFNGKFNEYLSEAQNALKPKIDPLMALAQKYLNEDALTDSKEDLK